MENTKYDTLKQTAKYVALATALTFTTCGLYAKCDKNQSTTTSVSSSVPSISLDFLLRQYVGIFGQEAIDLAETIGLLKKPSKPFTVGDIELSLEYNSIEGMEDN